MTDQAFTEENRRYWDQMSATYNSQPWQLKLQKQICDELRSKISFIGLPAQKSGNMRLLDYACGPGSVSAALAPFINSSVGIDLAAGMVEKYNAAFSSTGEVPGEAFVGDLCTPEGSAALEKPELYDFDIAAVALGFHHFASPESALKRLAERVKKGTGVVIVVDWFPGPMDGEQHGHEHTHGHHHHGHDESHAHPHEHAHDHQHGHHSHAQDAGALQTIRTHGFTEEDMRKLFDAAGCKDFAFSIMEEKVELFIGKPERKSVKTVFLARATRKE